MTYGFNGCPLSPNALNGATNLLLGNSVYATINNQVAWCTLSSGGNNTVESNVSAASTIAPGTGLFHITGTTPVSIMTPLAGTSNTITAVNGVGGCADFITDSALVFNSGTGIGQFKFSFTTTAGTLYTACYTPSTGLWYTRANGTSSVRAPRMLVKQKRKHTKKSVKK